MTQHLPARGPQHHRPARCGSARATLAVWRRLAATSLVAAAALTLVISGMAAGIPTSLVREDSFSAALHEGDAAEVASPALAVTHYPTQAPVTAMALSPSGRFLITAGQAGIEVRSVPAMTFVTRLSVDQQMIHDVQFAPHGLWLAIGGGTPGQFGIVDVLTWEEGADVPVASPLCRISEQEDCVYAVAWHSAAPRHEIPAAETRPSDTQGDITGRPEASEQPSLPEATASETPARNGLLCWLAAASLDGTCLLRKVSEPGADERQNERPDVRLAGHAHGLTGVCFLQSTTDLQVVTCSRDHTLRVWTMSEGRLLRTLNNHTAEVTGLALRPASHGDDQPPGPTLLASMADDRTVRFWQPELGRLVAFHRFDVRPSSLAWTRDGTILLVACQDGSVHEVWPAPLKVQQLVPARDSRIHVLLATDGAHRVIGGGRNGLMVVSSDNP